MKYEINFFSIAASVSSLFTGAHADKPIGNSERGDKYA